MSEETSGVQSLWLQEKSLFTREERIQEITDQLACGPAAMVIMRGLIGAGKSFVIEEILRILLKAGKRGRVGLIVSSDNFFSRIAQRHVPPKTYAQVFRPHLIPQAHLACQKDVWWHLVADDSDQCHARSHIIIDNTNSQLWEFEIYRMWAEHFHRLVRIWEVIPPFTSGNIPDIELLAQRNLHGVPHHAIAEMARRWESATHLRNHLYI